MTDAYRAYVTDTTLVVPGRLAAKVAVEAASLLAESSDAEVRVIGAALEYAAVRWLEVDRQLVAARVGRAVATIGDGCVTVSTPGLDAVVESKVPRVTATVAARELHLSTAAVRRAAREGRLQGERNGGQWWFSSAALDQYRRTRR